MNKSKLNPIQMMTLISAGILGVDILTVQRRMVEKAGRDAWISLLLGGLLTLISGTLSYLLSVQYPGKDLPEILIEIGGRFLGRIFLAAVAAYILLYLGVSIRVFTQALLIFLLDRTPIFVLILFISLVTGYAVFKDLDTIGKVVDILFPITMLTVFFIMLLALPQSNPIRLRPVLYHNTSDTLKAVLPGYQRFTGASLILYFMKHVRRSRGTFLWYLAGLVIPIVSYAALTLISIMVFGTRETITQAYPTLTLIKSIQFPSVFLERLESLAAVFWIGLVFNASTLFYYASVRNTIILFSIPEKYKTYIIWGHIALFMAIGLSKGQVWKAMERFDSARLLQSLITLVLFPLLLGFTLLKKRRRITKSHESTK